MLGSFEWHSTKTCSFESALLQDRGTGTTQAKRSKKAAAFGRFRESAGLYFWKLGRKSAIQDLLISTSLEEILQCLQLKFHLSARDVGCSSLSRRQPAWSTDTTLVVDAASQLKPRLPPSLK